MFEEKIAVLNQPLRPLQIFGAFLILGSTLAGDLLADTVLTGECTPDEHAVDLDSVRHAINDAREEAIIRQQGREAAAEEEGY